MPGNVLRHLTVIMLVSAAIAGCATIKPPVPKTPSEIAEEQRFARETLVFGSTDDYRGSTFEDVGQVELYPVRSTQECQVAVFNSGAIEHGES